MRTDIFLIIFGILLIVAMVLTLIYGREHGSHGYGAIRQAESVQPLPC